MTPQGWRQLAYGPDGLDGFNGGKTPPSDGEEENRVGNDWACMGVRAKGMLIAFGRKRRTINIKCPICGEGADHEGPRGPRGLFLLVERRIRRQAYSVHLFAICVFGGRDANLTDWGRQLRRGDI